MVLGGDEDDGLVLRSDDGSQQMQQEGRFVVGSDVVEGQLGADEEGDFGVGWQPS